MIQINLFTKQKHTHRLQKQIQGYQRGKVEGGINEFEVFPDGIAIKDWHIVTTMVWVQSLAWELLHATSAAKIKK